MTVVLAVVLLLRRRSERVTPQALRAICCDRFILAAGVLQITAIIGVNVGFGMGQAAGTIIVATSATYPVITMVLAVRHFDERPSIAAVSGAVLSVLGIMALYIV